MKLLTHDRQVVKVVQAQATSDGAGVRLKRSLGTSTLSDLDPFLLLDEFKSDDPKDYIAGFPSHPHRGFETVTYMIAGSVLHKDSKGNEGIVKAGGVQWMTAARGIIHSEMPQRQNGLLWGFQLWVNLPSAKKMTDPRYQNIEPEEVPELSLENGGRIKIIAGNLAGVEGVVKGISVDPTYMDIFLPPKAEFSHLIQRRHTAFVYVFEGEGRFGSGENQKGQLVKTGELGIFGSGEKVTINTENSAVRFLLLAGVPLYEPVVRYGPFVMNTNEEIEQAIADFSDGGLDR
ncbi:pirin family protein [bacterium]|nr:pirin family protein [bacterium]